MSDSTDDATMIGIHGPRGGRRGPLLAKPNCRVIYNDTGSITIRFDDFQGKGCSGAILMSGEAALDLYRQLGAALKQAIEAAS